MVTQAYIPVGQDRKGKTIAAEIWAKTGATPTLFNFFYVWQSEY